MLKIENKQSSFPCNIFFSSEAANSSEAIVIAAQDIFNEIFSYLDISTLNKCTLLDWNWKIFVDGIVDAHVNDIKNKILKYAFGPENWKELGLAMHPVKDLIWSYLLLPKNIDEILNSPYPLDSECGKSIKETHILVYIPENISPTAFGMQIAKYLTQAEHRKPGFDWIPNEILNKFDCPAKNARWVLFPKHSLPDSANKSRSQLEEIMKRYSNVYDFPEMLDVIFCAYSELMNGNNLLSDEHTFCKEKVNKLNSVIAGKISQSGIKVDFTLGNSPTCGLNPVRKFSSLALRTSQS